MDWALIAEELRKGAKAYKIFEEGAEAAQEMVNAEHRLANLQSDAAKNEQDLGATKRELVLVQGAVQEAKNQLNQLTQSVARVSPQAKQAEDALTRAQTALALAKAEIAADKALQTAQQDEATQRLAIVKAEWQKVSTEITKLQGIRDTLKAQLAQV